jgi:Flp pilus assembly protein TadG
MTAPNTLRKILDDDGQAILETAISLSVAISLAFWLFELCMFTYTCAVLNSATQQGVRYAIVHGTDSASCSGPDSTCADNSPYSNVRTIVTAAASASLHNTTAMTVTVTYANGTAAPGNPVTVASMYTYIPYITLPGIGNTVRFSSTGQILY